MAQSKGITILENYKCKKTCFWNNSLTTAGEIVLVPRHLLDEDKRFKKIGIYKQVDPEGEVIDVPLSEAQAKNLLQESTKK